MEEFFRDLFSDFQESSPGSVPALAYEQLVRMYLRVLRETTDWIGRDSRMGGPVGRLLADAAAVSDELIIITFNHDLVIENEIVKRARLRSRWCIEQGYGRLAAKLHYSRPPVRSSTFGLHTTNCDHSQPISVLKLHGSLNWYVRMNSSHPSRSVLTGSGAPPDMHCHRRRTLPVNLTWSNRTSRGRTKWDTWPIVIPPVQGKESLIRRFVPEVWSDAESALSDSNRIVFVGYSLPLLDIHAERLFRRWVGLNALVEWVDVINPAPESAQRYASAVTPTPLRWYESIERFLDNDGF
jgi:hypothetical protein